MVEGDLQAALRNFSDVYMGAKDKDRFIKLVGLQYGTIALSRPTLKRLALDPESASQIRGKTKAFLQQFHRDGLIDDLDEIDSAYKFFCKRLSTTVSQQAVIADFKGIYQIFRRGTDGLVTGSIEIGMKGQMPWFWHSSTQNLRGSDQLFVHEGFVFFEVNRFYMLGIGPQYVRMITLKRVSEPHKNPMPGILLTEKLEYDHDLVPLSAKTVMVHENLDLSDSQLELYLGNEAELEGVVYGWVKSDPA